MKILAIGDFHGKFPEKIKSLIEREKPDLILSNGDYSGIDDFRPAFNKMFKALEKGKEFSITEYFGEKKYKELLKKDFDFGKMPIKELNKFGIFVLSVFGNGDWYKWEGGDKKRDYSKLIKKLKNIKNINRGSVNFKEIKIAGFGGYLEPDIYFSKKGKKAINLNEERDEKRRKRYGKWESQLMRIVSGADIVLAHYTPLNCLDKMEKKGSMLSGQHMGVSSYNRAIKKYKPVLFVCGHMHENQGSCKFGRTLVVNPGPANEGKAGVIDFDEKRKKVLSVRFVR